MNQTFRARHTLLAAVGVALVASTVALPAASSDATGRRTVGVRVATYNTCGQGCLPTREACEAVIGRDCATKLKPWRESRAASVAANIAASRADVVATQEIGNNATPTQQGIDVESFRAPLTRAMRAEGYAQAPADYEGATHPTKGYPLKSGAGRFTYYDADKISQRDRRGRALPRGLLWLPDSTEIYGKTMTWNVLRDRSTGGRFVVVDLHLEYRQNGATDPNGWTKNWDRVRYVDAKRTIAHVTKQNKATRNLPVVFAGDMNSSSMADGASAYDAFADAGYEDARVATPASRRRGEEYPSFNGGKIPLPKGADVDYIFAKEGTRSTSWRLEPETRAASGSVVDLLDSDHNLISARLALPVRR